ncbi:MAG: hypothetical protein V7K26_27405 [Nostoc sp.]|uniref:hypothetical protein n=1 Tax=Nostoc sp. TaxID=1180 RepID=UPI002FF32601
MFTKNLFFYTFALINLFIASCNDRYSPGEEPHYEKIGQETIISMINIQKKHFLKYKNFFKPPDRPLKSNSSFFNHEKCYGYYSKNVKQTNTNLTVDGIYSYVIQEACGGNWGIDLSHYVGGIFAIPITNSKDIKIVSIVCESDGPAYAPLDYLPEYRNGLVDCPSKANKVYSNIEILKIKTNVFQSM